MNNDRITDARQNRRVTPFHTTLLLEIGDIHAEISLDDGFLYPERLTASPHMHVEWEVQVPICGSYQIGLYDSDERICMCPGNLLLLPPGCYHSTFCESREDAASVRAEKFAFRFLLSRGNPDEEPLFRGVMKTLSSKMKPQLMRSPDPAILTDMWTEIMENRPGSTILAQADLQRFFMLFLRLLLEEEEASFLSDLGSGQHTDIGSGTITKQNRVMRLMDELYHTSLTEQSIADMLGISVRSVSRLFSNTFGMSFKQKLTEVRMYHAKKYLVETDIPAEQIASRIGYESLSAFYAAFGNTFGIPPGQYRKKHKTERYLPEIGQNSTENGVLHY